MKKKITYLMLALLIGTAASATAQVASSARQGKGRPGMERMAEQMAKNLKLDEATTAWFVPIYKEYQDTLRAVRRTATRPGKNKMTDADVTAFIEKSFSATESEVALKRQYYARFKEKLTPVQLMSIFNRPAGGQQQPRQGQGPRPGGQRQGFGQGMPDGGPGQDF